MKIQRIDFQKYFKQKTAKNQIVVHHTVSSGSPYNVVNYWNKLRYNIATHFIIGKDGTIFQLFDLDYWAYHIGKTVKENTKFGIPRRNCSKYSIGIEMINLGGLLSRNNKLYTVYGKLFRGNFLQYNPPFRGFNFFEKYTLEQLNSLNWLLDKLSQELSIPREAKYTKFDLNEYALAGHPGIYGHIHYRMDKSDPHPQKELLQILKMKGNVEY